MTTVGTIFSYSLSLPGRPKKRWWFTAAVKAATQAGRWRDDCVRKRSCKMSLFFRAAGKNGLKRGNEQNAERRTPNTEHRMGGREFCVRSWAFGVGRSTFSVFS